VLLGEAAHFVVGSACALRRDSGEGVFSLFLIGLAKLNRCLQADTREDDPFIDRPNRPLGIEAAVVNSNCSAAVIQSAFLTSPNTDRTCDVLEELVKSDSTCGAYQLLSKLAGECLPKRRTCTYRPMPLGMSHFLAC
jgi:hypothetical protein